MTPIDLAVLIAYSFALGLLAIYGVHRLHLVRLRRRCRTDNPVCPDVQDCLSYTVTVQLPLYNEPNVAARLIDAVAQLRYDGALDVQVLDDSTDRTSEIVADRVAHWRARGVSLAHVRRGTRDGFKAGALAYGMSLSSAQFFEAVASAPALK